MSYAVTTFVTSAIVDCFFLVSYISSNTGVGRFKILEGAKGGPNSQQAHDVVTTSMRRNDVASTSFRRRVAIRFLINQCQIITFLILKYDIENSRIELRGIVLPVQMGGLLGGPKGMLAPLSNYWGAWPPLPPLLPTPMSNGYFSAVYVDCLVTALKSLLDVLYCRVTALDKQLNSRMIACIR